MKLTQRDIGQRFKVKGQGQGVLIALSANGKTAYLDMYPDISGKFKGRYKAFPVEHLHRVHAAQKGRAA